MKNKFLAIFLGIIISLFFANHCFALNPPTDLSITNIGEGSALCNWSWEEGGGTIDHFQILWRKETEPSTENWTEELPAAEGSSPYSFSLKGLEAGTLYEWRIKAEATSPSQDSGYLDGPLFTTEESQWEDEEDEEDEEDGEDGEGISITLISLFKNIGNIQDAADAFMEFALLVGFAIGPILIIYAGFLLLTKQGDPIATAKAQKIILLTVISLSIMLFAKGVPSVVESLFK